MSEIQQTTAWGAPIVTKQKLSNKIQDRVLEYLDQGYSMQEAQDKAASDQLQHTSFMLPDVDITAQAPVQKQLAIESDWTPEDYNAAKSPNKTIVHYNAQDDANLDRAWKYGGYYKGKYIPKSNYANLGNEVALAIGVPLVAANPVTGMLAGAALDGAAAAGSTIGSAVTAFKAAHPALYAGIKTGLDIIFTADGVRNALSNNGIQKTYRIGKDIYQNGLTGQKAWDFTKSLAGDVLDIAGTTGSVKLAKNAFNKTIRPAIKGNALVYGSQLALEHPEIANKVLTVADKINPRVTETINRFNIDKLASYNTDFSYKGKVLVPTSMPPKRKVIDRNTWASAPVHFRERAIGVRPEQQWYTEAALEGRYLPAMSLNEYRNYYKNVQNTGDESLDYVTKFNKKQALSQAAEDKYTQVRDLSYRYSNEGMKLTEDSYKLSKALNEAGVSISDSQRVYEVARQLGMTDDYTRRLKYSSQALSNPVLAGDAVAQYREGLNRLKALEASPIESFSPLQNNLRPRISLHRNTNVFDGIKRDEFGRRVPVHNADGQMRYDSNTLNLALLTNPNIVRPMRAKYTGGHSVREILGHEADHWAQRKISDIKSTSRVTKDPLVIGNQKPYYHINSNSRFVRNHYPELEKVPYINWQSSPHEWRSEMVGAAFDRGASPNITKWTQDDYSAIGEFLNNRFYKVNNELHSIDPALNIGDITYDMVKKGFKQGGKLNYLNYFN